MSKQFPSRPHLRNLQNQAKRLLKGHRERKPAAVRRLRAHLDRFSAATTAEIVSAPVTLRDAQEVIAREYGFAVWVDLKRHVESITGQAPAVDDDPPDEVSLLLQAVEAGDAPLVEDQLRQNPALAMAHLERSSGEMACMTQLHRTDRLAAGQGRMTEAHLQVAQLLIDHGADVNAIVDGFSPPLDVAAWSGNIQLAELLLANGADPDLGTEARPVDTALSHGHRVIFDLLVRHGAQYSLEHTIQLGLMKETRALLDEDPERANEPLPGGHMPLTLAAGRPAVFNLLLRRGADIHVRDARGYTPMLAAREAGNDRAVQVLLERGASEDIFSAIAQRDVAKVAAILRADPAQAHPVGNGPPPILWAIRSESMAIVDLLLKQKVEVDIYRQHQGGTPLNLAIVHHLDDIVRRLLEYGADPDPKDYRNWPGWQEDPSYPVSTDRTLYQAMRFGTLTAANLLLEAGADVNFEVRGLTWTGGENDGRLDRVKFLLDWGADMRLPHHAKLFVDAAYRGRLALVELFATHGEGVDLEAVGSVGNKKERTALEWATRRDLGDTVSLLEDLAEIARRPRREADHIMRSRRRFIHAVIDGDADTLRSLVAAEPALAQRPVARGPLFGYAAERGHGEVADILVEHGAPWTISAAAQLGRVEQLGMLLDDDPSLLHEAAPLHAAAGANQAEAIEFLLDRGANIDQQMGKGHSTALHYAVQRKAINAIEALLVRGANVHIKQRGQRTPLGRNMPPTLDRIPIRDLLISYGANPGGR